MDDNLISELEEISSYLTDGDSGQSMTLTKCPMYCPSNCSLQHHPLLVAILNCVDTPEIELMEDKLLMLSNMINKYTQSGQWSGNDPIPDVVEKYRAPMLHWVATCGLVGAAIWLIGRNISDPTTKSTVYNGETALHRALLCLQETCPLEPGHKFVQLLSVLEPALSVADDNGNTPLHVCCDRLKAGMERSDYYKKCLHYMLYELSNEKKVPRHDIAVVLNMKNNDGDTALHFLATNDKHLAEVKSLIQFGADFTSENNEGLAPFDVAKKNLCSVICAFFDTLVVGEHLKGGKSKHLEDKMEFSAANPCSSSSSSSSSSSQSENNSECDQLSSVNKLTDDSNGKDTRQTADTDIDDTSANKRLRLDGTLLSSSVVGQSHLQTEGQVMESSNQTDHEQAGHVLAMPKLFSGEKDADAQKYFEQAVSKYISSLKSKKPTKKTAVTLFEFPQLPSCLSLVTGDDKEIVKKMLMEADPAAVTRYLISAEEAGVCCEPVIQFMLNTRNDALTKLKLANKCEDGVQQLLKDNQKTQESLVSDIMLKYDSLTKLNKEEQTLSSELEKIREHAAVAKTANSNLRERLNNCEAALDVLKRLYAEATGKVSKS